MSKNQIVLWVLTISLLMIGNALSAIGVVYNKHYIRLQFSELQKLKRGQDKLNIKWKQMLLEKGTLVRYSRIDDISKHQLGLQIPNTKDIHYIFRE
jgi:cell division protein FtsL